MSFYAKASIILAALGGVLFGYNTAVIAGALLFIKAQFHLSPSMEGWVVSILLLGAVASTSISGVLADKFGRRFTMLLSAFLFLLGCICAAKAPNPAILCLGRFITGLGVGSNSVVAPLYLGEIAPTKIRGSIVTLYSLAITIGIVVSYAVNYLFATTADWSSMLLFGGIPAALQLMFSFFLVESPRWLFSQGKTTKAKTLIHTLNLQDLVEEPQKPSPLPSAKSTMTSIRWALTVGILLSFFQQITGINAVIYYAPTIFELTGFSSSETAILATLGIGSVNVLATVLAIRILDHLGRRTMLFISLSGMILSLGATILSLYLYKGHAPILSAIALTSYVAFFALGLGPLTWVILSEIYPSTLRGKAIAMALLINWGTNYLLALSFADIMNYLGLELPFFLFLLISIAALLFVFKIPETRGKSFEEIEKLFEK